jgi:glycine cleavage system regulatory protein
MATFVLTVLGDDRPGLVDELSGVISAHGGNWEHSQMARLGGKFAGIVQISVPNHSAAALQDALDTLNDEGPLHIRIDGAGDAPAPTGTHFVLSMVGTDRPGLVHSVAAALAAVGASIEQLDTSTKSAAMSGGTLFEARAVVSLPPSVRIDDVRAQLEELADHLMVDLEFDD